jgi:hypothetical protein
MALFHLACRWLTLVHRCVPAFMKTGGTTLPAPRSIMGRQDASCSYIHGLKERPVKKWEITFLDPKGILTRLPLDAEQQPSPEEAAQAVRAHLFPVTAKADLNDFEGRVAEPTVKWLEEQNGVKISAIDEVA